jgi:hypothetical protein
MLRKYSVAGSSVPSSRRTRRTSRPWLRPKRASAPATTTTPSPSRMKIRPGVPPYRPLDTDAAMIRRRVDPW